MYIFYNQAGNEFYAVTDYWPAFMYISECMWMVPGTFPPD